MPLQKRILIISYHTCPLASEEGKETGGMNVYVYELARSLAHLGFLIDVITRCQDKDNEKIVTVGQNFRVIHLVAGPQAPVNKKHLTQFIPEFVMSFLSFVSSEKQTYDLMHAHYYQSGLIGLEIQKKFPRKLPLVMTFHTLALMKNLVARSAGELDSSARITAEYLLMVKSDAIITPSQNDQQYLKYLYNVPEEKIFEIPPGVNRELFKPMVKSLAKSHLKIASDEKIILFVGRIEPLKGIDSLLYALKILRAQIPTTSLRLLIVGGDISQHIRKWSSQLQQLRQLRHILGITKFVDFVGQKPQHELPNYYNAAEMVVMPSHYESFGMAATEAMACGTPVITTNVTGVSNLIDDRQATLITTVNNPLLLASQIRRLLEDHKLYQQIRRNLLNHTQDLKWEVIAQQIADVYTRLMPRG